MKLTRDKLLAFAASNNKGFNSHQLKLLGVPTPPVKGWMRSLEGKEISDEVWSKVVAISGMTRGQRNKFLKCQDTPVLF